MKIEREREEDGRWIAEVPDLPGVMLYGRSRDEAISKVKALAFAGPILVSSYPVYWLPNEPGLFVIYLLSLVVFGASVLRTNCPRGLHKDRPVNRFNICSS